MPLPSLEKIVPQFDITIPSTGETIKFRPFLVKEEKLLLMALESNDDKAMMDAVAQVVTSCAMAPIKMDTLANFDLEYIFLQLRCRSVNEIVELNYKCRNEIDLSPEQVSARFRGRKLEEGEVVSGVCDTIVKMKINLDHVKVKFQEGHLKQIFLSDNIGVNMRYPSFKMAKTFFVNRQQETVNDVIQAIAMCIESVFDSDSVYSNFTTKEVQEWLEKLTQPQFEKLQSFFESMPKLAHDVDFTCPSCGYHQQLHLEGLASFFG